MIQSPTLEKLKIEMEERMDEHMLLSCGLTRSTVDDIRYAMGRAYNEVAPAQEDLEDIAADLGYVPKRTTPVFWIDFEVYISEHLSVHAAAYAAAYFNGDDPRFNGDRRVVLTVTPTSGVRFHSLEVGTRPWHPPGLPLDYEPSPNA